jgi:hypothetical protein
LETYNQFAVYNLILRNYLDLTPDGDYIEDKHSDGNSLRDTTDTSSLGSKVVDDRQSVTTTDESTKVEDLSIGESETTIKENKAENKTEKVRWLVER